MFKLFILLSSMCALLLTTVADSMIGPGKWHLLKIEKKPGDFLKFEFDLVQRKFNRTHDMFQGAITCHEDLGDLYGARLDICKHCDGGCKKYQVLSDNSFGSLVDKYAAGNFEEMFKLAGIANPKFPIPAGKYEFDKYLWNWDSMPEEGPYGHYTAHCCVMEMGQEVGCLTVEVEFEETDDDDDEED